MGGEQKMRYPMMPIPSVLSLHELIFDIFGVYGGLEMNDIVFFFTSFTIGVE